MAEAVEHAMEAKKMGINLTPEEKFEVFGDKDPERYGEEAERRWGGTEGYDETRRRVARYGKADWKRMRDEVADWGARYEALMAAGEPATGERAADMAEEHRRHITMWFYDCTREIHRGLGDLYVSDERFREFYESMRQGLAEHLREAIHANADRRA